MSHWHLKTLADGAWDQWEAWESRCKIYWKTLESTEVGEKGAWGPLVPQKLLGFWMGPAGQEPTLF